MKKISILLLPAVLLLMAGATALAGSAVTTDKTVRSTSTSDENLLKDYFRPVLDLRYTYDRDMDFTDFNGHLSMHEAEITVPLPPVLSPHFYLLTDLNYRYYQMTVDTPGMNGKFDLHTFRVPIKAVWLSANTPWFVYADVAPGISSDFNSASRDSFDLSATLDIGYRFSPRLVVAFGAYYTRDYGDDLLIPNIGLMWAPNDTFSLKITSKGIVSTFNCSEDWHIKVKGIPYGGRWIVDSANGGGRERIELSGAKVGVDIERRISKQAWLSVGAGVNVFSNLRYVDGTGREVLDRDLEPALYVTAGLVWTF